MPENTVTGTHRPEFAACQKVARGGRQQSILVIPVREHLGHRSDVIQLVFGVADLFQARRNWRRIEPLDSGFDVRPQGPRGLDELFRCRKAPACLTKKPRRSLGNGHRPS